MTTETRPTAELDGFNPFDPATLQCPFPHDAAMRAVDPVHEVAGMAMFRVVTCDITLGGVDLPAGATPRQKPAT